MHTFTHPPAHNSLHYASHHYHQINVLSRINVDATLQNINNISNIKILVRLPQHSRGGGGTKLFDIEATHFIPGASPFTYQIKAVPIILHINKSEWLPHGGMFFFFAFFLFFYCFGFCFDSSLLSIPMCRDIFSFYVTSEAQDSISSSISISLVQAISTDIPRPDLDLISPITPTTPTTTPTTAATSMSSTTTTTRRALGDQDGDDNDMDDDHGTTTTTTSCCNDVPYVPLCTPTKYSFIPRDT